MTTTSPCSPRIVSPATSAPRELVPVLIQAPLMRESKCTVVGGVMPDSALWANAEVPDIHGRALHNQSTITTDHCEMHDAKEN